jgi:hypothetical protein
VCFFYNFFLLWSVFLRPLLLFSLGFIVRPVPWRVILSCSCAGRLWCGSPLALAPPPSRSSPFPRRSLPPRLSPSPSPITPPPPAPGTRPGSRPRSPPPAPRPPARPPRRSLPRHRGRPGGAPGRGPPRAERPGDPGGGGRHGGGAGPGGPGSGPGARGRGLGGAAAPPDWAGALGAPARAARAAERAVMSALCPPRVGRGLCLLLCWGAFRPFPLLSTCSAPSAAPYVRQSWNLWWRFFCATVAGRGRRFGPYRPASLVFCRRGCFRPPERSEDPEPSAAGDVVAVFCCRASCVGRRSGFSSQSSRGNTTPHAARITAASHVDVTRPLRRLLPPFHRHLRFGEQAPALATLTPLAGRQPGWSFAAPARPDAQITPPPARRPPPRTRPPPRVEPRRDADSPAAAPPPPEAPAPPPRARALSSTPAQHSTCERTVM